MLKAQVQAFLAVFALVCCLGLSGCGGTERTPLIKVKGKVTYLGEPVRGGEVVFQPSTRLSLGPVRVAKAEIQQDGSYEISTYSPGDGAMPGDYDVAIRSAGAENWVLPERFSNFYTSGLRLVLLEDAAKLPFIEYDLNLTDELPKAEEAGPEDAESSEEAEGSAEADPS